MSESDVNWWMDPHSRWHEGVPPPDWWQASDGRWYPPTSGDPTEEETLDPAVGGVHLAEGGRWQNLVDSYWGWPAWARIAAPVSGVILAIGAVAALAMLAFRDDDGTLALARDATTTRPEVTVPSTTAANAAPGATTTASTATTVPGPTTTETPQPDPTSTTVAPPPSTTPPPTNGGVQLRAFCSPEGATAVSNEGVPVTCTTQKCHGAPYDQPRWRQTTC